MSEAEVKKLVSQSVFESINTMMDLAYAWGNPSKKTIDRVATVNGAEELDAAYKENKGVILAAPHFGCWEVIGPWCAQFYKCNYLYRPPKVKELEDFMISSRTKNGARIHPTNAKGVRNMFQALKSGELIGILPDQEPTEGEGVFAPFFGIEAKTMVLLSKFAAKSNAAVFISYAVRTGVSDYQLNFIRIADDIYSKDINKSVLKLNSSIEAEVRKFPSQYQWTYKRFKSRPDGQRNFY